MTEAKSRLDTILAEVRKHCVLVYIEFNKYGGRALVENGKLVVDGVTLDDEEDSKRITRSSWTFLPDSWHKALNKVEGKSKRVVRAVGTLFKRGVYMIPHDSFGAVYQELEEVRREHSQVCADLCATWPDILDNYVGDWFTRNFGLAAWSDIRNRLPKTSGEVLAKHQMKIGLWPLGVDAGGSYGLVDKIRQKFTELSGLLPEQYDLGNRFTSTWNELQGHIDTLVHEAGVDHRPVSGEMLVKHMDMARRATAEMLESTLKRQFDEPRRELHEAITEFLGKIDEGIVVRQQSVDKLRRIWAKLEGFSWLAPVELAERMNELRASMSADSTDVNNRTDVGQAMINMLTSIRQDLNASEMPSTRFLDV